MKVFEKFVARLRIQEAKEEMKEKISKGSSNYHHQYFIKFFL